MRIVERSNDRLVLRTGCPLVWSSRLEIDKIAGVARIERRTLLSPTETNNIVLSQIRAVRLIKRRRRRGWTYRASLALHGDRSVEMIGLGRRELRRAVAIIRAFMPIDARPEADGD